MAATTLPYNPRYRFAPVEDTEVGVQQTRIFVEGTRDAAMRELLRAYQDACAGVIARYDGYAAKFMGDRVYAYFG